MCQGFSVWLEVGWRVAGLIITREQSGTPTQVKKVAQSSLILCPCHHCCRNKEGPQTGHRLSISLNQAPSVGEEEGLCLWLLWLCMWELGRGWELFHTPPWVPTPSRQVEDRGMHSAVSSCSLLCYSDDETFCKHAAVWIKWKEAFKIKCKQTDE